MSRTVTKIGDDKFEFITSQPPKHERITIVGIKMRIEWCDREIAHATAQKESAITRKAEWVEKLAEAEKLNGRV